MDSKDIIRPESAQDLAEVVSAAAAAGTPIEVRGGGSKRHIGRPGRSARIVDIGGLSGIVDYEPSELVLTVRPGTPLAQVEQLLAAHGQMLAFEPWDHGCLDGTAGAATIGGVIAAGVSGSRRVSAGGARDHLLGFSAVSGRGEPFKAGGKVVKNVTGYDVSKLMAGSWGQLAVFTELSVKVLPRPRAATSVALRGLPVGSAVEAMARGLGSTASPAAAAHVPGRDGRGSTVLRVEGFAESVAARVDQLRTRLAPFGALDVLEPGDADSLWQSACTAASLPRADCLWRVHLAPGRAADLANKLERAEATWLLDWGGALAWASAAATVDMHAIAAQAGGHALLVRASADIRAAIRARTAESRAVAALAARVRRAFDPAAILDPERFA
ncbi:MAG: FAD-binding protein [Sphingomonadales bacterium]|nr:FAD-binding protein [Sphingomonadales bacterium]